MSVLRFQSTLLREERHLPSADIIDAAKVSIHAPTRGATFYYGYNGGAAVFQSTLLREERRGMSTTVDLFGRVSIHAPTRGATINKVIQFYPYLCFNPRSYARSDSFIAQGSMILQSFNPRSYARSDPSWGAQSSSTTWFQSTLLREERPGPKISTVYRRTFQSTLLREERPERGLGRGSGRRCFNPRSYARSDTAWGDVIHACVRFNPRSYARSDVRGQSAP